jgi:hypothetical protein
LRKDGKLRLHVTTADGAGLHALGETVDVQFKLPVNGRGRHSTGAGQALNPIWAADGQLIVLTGANVGGDAPLLAIRPDGTPVDFPSIRVRRFGERIASKRLLRTTRVDERRFQVGLVTFKTVH